MDILTVRRGHRKTGQRGLDQAEVAFLLERASKGSTQTCAQAAVTFVPAVPSFGSRPRGYLVSCCSPSAVPVFQFITAGKRSGHTASFLGDAACVFGKNCCP